MSTPDQARAAVPTSGSLLRVERQLVVVRAVLAVLVVAMGVFYDPVARPVVLAAGVALGVVAVAVARRLAVRPPSPRRLSRFGRGVLLVDASLVALAYGLLIWDARAMPVGLVVLLVYAIALRGRAPGVLLAGLVLVLALGGRVLVQAWVLPDGVLRPELMVLWAALGVLMVAFSREFWAQEHRRAAAWAARRAVADDLNAIVVRTLERVGLSPQTATHAEVMAAVRGIVEGADGDRDELVERLAGILSAPHRGLTPRELEILSLLGRGHPDSRIAAALFISPSTVRNHVKSLRDKLGLGSREELREYARRHAPPA
ncbi:MAG TPA: helix-turn-helix transcriptional regulator [Egicoccus sp.]|nr:helix-turn-helix transcriptional regulator [Egicoccus sp.]HSK21755.1 helix-turn-helix transcriptional regulator [Egicoccus sp.]